MDMIVNDLFWFAAERHGWRAGLLMMTKFEIPLANFGQFSPRLTLEKNVMFAPPPPPAPTYIFAFSTFR